MNKSLSPTRCIIADDTRSPRELVAHWLRRCQFACDLAVDGQQAWTYINDDPPDLLITDLEMPRMSGFHLLERVRNASCRRIRNLPVIVMTSLEDGQTLDAVRKLGGNALLTKPLEKKSALSVVLNLVAGRHVLGSEDDAYHNVAPAVISPTLRHLLMTVAS